MSGDAPDNLAEYTRREYDRLVERLAEDIEELARRVRRKGRAQPSLRNPDSVDYMGAACDVLKEMDWAVANMNTYQIVRAAQQAQEVEQAGTP